MIEPRYSSVETMHFLREAGIQTARDRVNRLADALFGRDEFGTLRRYTPDQVLTLKTAFELLDHEELPRKLVVSLFTDPDPVFAAMSETMRRSRDSLAQTLADAEDAAHQFSDAAGTAERAAAVRRVDEAFNTIRRVSRLVAA